MKTRTVCAAMLLMLAGCVTKPIDPTPATVAAGVKPGDAIQLVTQSGSDGRYRVLGVDSAGLRVEPQADGGKQAPVQSIPYTDIREVTVTRLNTKAIGTGLTVAAAVTTVLMIWAAEYVGAVVCC